MLGTLAAFVPVAVARDDHARPRDGDGRPQRRRSAAAARALVCTAGNSLGVLAWGALAAAGLAAVVATSVDRRSPSSSSPARWS